MTAERITEAELEDLKRRKPCDEVAARWVTLRRNGKKMVGPCPMHSPDPHARDSTSFECTAESWVCAVCHDGGDVIKLIAKRENLDPHKDFRKIVEILGGTREINAEEATRAERARAQIRAQREREAQQFRDRELKRLFEWWHNAEEVAGTDVERYLERRRCPAPPAKPSRIRFRTQHELYSGSNMVHRGSAMLAAIVNAEGKFRALHATWLDLSKPKGKASIVDPATGEVLPSKKVRGSKAGGRIELVPIAEPKRLIIGEGIETVLSVYNALAGAGRDLRGIAFWAAVDLGNLAGKAAGSIPHPSLKTPTGRTERVPGRVPDTKSPAIGIPDCVEDIVLLGDSDSDRFLTECALARAAARFAKPFRTVRVAWAQPGQDFNDMLLAGGADAIVRLIDGATAPIAIVASNPEPAPTSKGKKKKSSQMRGSSGKPLTGDKGGESGPPDDGDLNVRLAFYPQTDLGNAERFRDRKRATLCYNQAVGWLSWDGKRWAREHADGFVMRAAHEVARAIQFEARAITGTTRDTKIGEERDRSSIMLSDKLKRWGRTSESANKLLAISKHAAAYLEVSTSQLDSDLFAINVANGTLEIRRNPDGDCICFRTHDPKDLITKLAPVKHDSTATCPTFDKFLAEVQPRQSVRRFLQQWFGLSLTGYTRAQRLIFNYGKGQNGKSTLLNTICHVAGDYAKSLPIETFLDQGKGRNAGAATPDLAILPGVRLLRTSEPERGAKLAEALIKLATGGEPIQARHLNHDYFEYLPQFKLTMSGNHRPEIVGTDDGIWRRMTLVPWEVKIEKPDDLLEDKLKAEASGILNWLLDGIRDWLDHGLILPEEVVEATAAFRADSNPIGRFLEACTVPDPGAREPSATLYSVFVAWAKANGERESTKQYFGRALRDQGLKQQTSHVSFWIGVRLVKVESDFIDQHGDPITQDDAKRPNSDSKSAILDDEFTG